MLWLHTGAHRKNKKKQKQKQKPTIFNGIFRICSGIGSMSAQQFRLYQNKFVAVFSHERRSHRLPPSPFSSTTVDDLI